MASRLTLSINTLLQRCIIIITIYMNVIRGQQTIECADPAGCNWICQMNRYCDDNTYICPSTVASCSLTCKSCVNTHVVTSASNFNINCVANTGCINMDITAQTATSNIQLSCISSLCSALTLNCPSTTSENCQCMDDGLNICTNQVNGIWGSSNPTTSPSNNPSVSPTKQPTLFPTKSPSVFATTASPSHYPTTSPSVYPTMSPSIFPTTSPSRYPRKIPSPYPTASPSLHPTISPSVYPTASPSRYPTKIPSRYPTTSPSLHPATSPSVYPTTSLITTTTAITSSITQTKQSSSSSPTKLPSIYPTTSPITSTTSTPAITTPSNTSASSTIHNTTTSTTTTATPSPIITTNNIVIEIHNIVNATRIIHVYSHQPISMANISIIGLIIVPVLFCCILCIILFLFIVYMNKKTKKSEIDAKSEILAVKRKNAMVIGEFSGEFNIDVHSPATVDAQYDDDVMCVLPNRERQKTCSSALYGSGAEGDVVTGGKRQEIFSIDHDNDELELKELEELQESITETMDPMGSFIDNMSLPLSPLVKSTLVNIQSNMDILVEENEDDDVDEDNRMIIKTDTCDYVD